MNSGYVGHRFNVEALRCFRQMQDERIVPNAVTFICSLKGSGILGCIEMGEDIATEVRKQGLLQKDIKTDNALVGIYSKCSALEKACKVFEGRMLCLGTFS